MATTNPTDPNKIRLTGENSFIRLTDAAGEAQTTRSSHWRVLWSPGGTGHVLFIQSELTDDQVKIYSDNIALARWLQDEIESLLYPDFADQTMPIIDKVVGEFVEKGVELIAVNLEEQPAQIKSMMERHKMQMTVALDRDGVVAFKYAATAIPQTVVIDRDGKVTRLFVGGGLKLEEPLRQALEEATADKNTPPKPE